MEYFDLTFEFDGTLYNFTCTYELDDSTGLCFDDSDILIAQPSVRRIPQSDTEYVSILPLLRDEVAQAIMIQLQQEVVEFHKER